MVTGKRDLLSDAAREIIRQAGIFHIITISGVCVAVPRHNPLDKRQVRWTFDLCENSEQGLPLAPIPGRIPCYRGKAGEWESDGDGREDHELGS
jgi:hypothetical protein